MRRLLVLLVLVLGASWALAQDTSSQANPGSNSAGGETTVQGCLSGSSGSYTVSDSSGTTYQLTGDTSKLAEQVGHEIKVTGTSAASGSSASAGSSATAPTAAGQSGGAAQKTLQVSSVKQISKTCQSAGAAH